MCAGFIAAPLVRCWQRAGAGFFVSRTAILFLSAALSLAVSSSKSEIQSGGADQGRQDQDRGRDYKLA